VIAQETIDRIRQQTGLVELIGETVKLVRRGRSHVGLCPFHKEKTPSFHVNEERGFYHCFGCGEHGDAFKFVQNVEGLEFIEAVRRLAERAGIQIVETANDAERRRQSDARRRQQELFEAGEAAAAFFERMLREHSLSKYAQDELAKRGLVAEGPTGPIADTLQAFRIGYAPQGWDSLAKHLREAGISVRAAEAVGLIVPRKSGSGHYDRFRHRLMFAVLDVQGRVIAFSGRTLSEPSAQELTALGLEPSLGGGEAAAKYVNSPESPIYRKREAVFGLYQARQALREKQECVLVEGNFDVVSLHARGIRHVVAPLGTAFTIEQARLIKRFSPGLTLLFDADSAGRRAMRAAREPCMAAGLQTKAAILPDGTDPDDLVRQRGAEGMERVLSGAQSLLLQLIRSELDTTFAASDAAGKAARVRGVTELLASESDPVARELAKTFADTMAGKLLSPDELQDATGAARTGTLAALERSIRQALQRDGASPPQARTARPEPPSRARSRDRRNDIGLEVVGAILDYPELLASAEFEDGLRSIEGDAAIAIAALRQCERAGTLADPEQLLAKLPSSIHPFALARLAAPQHTRLEDAKTELVGNVNKLKGLELSRQRSEVVEEIERAAEQGDFEQEDALLRAHSEKQQRRALERRGLGER
jgi:DNA primase